MFTLASDASPAHSLAAIAAQYGAAVFVTLLCVYGFVLLFALYGALGHGGARYQPIAPARRINRSGAAIRASRR